MNIVLHILNYETKNFYINNSIQKIELKLMGFGVIRKEWFENFLNFKYVIPSVPTIRDIITIIDSKELE